MLEISRYSVRLSSQQVYPMQVQISPTQVLLFQKWACCPKLVMVLVLQI
jgi:hypothetical protein